MDQMVLKTQKYLNENYRGKNGYNVISEDGITGWGTIYALTRALQIELGLSAPANNFGNASANAFNQKYPAGIKEQPAGATETSGVYAIIQGALWCKGYGTGDYSITRNFYGNTGTAIKRLKEDAGFEDPDSTVTLNVMKALLSMDQFKVILSQGGTNTIRAIQQQLNRKYEKYIGLIPCDGLYGRDMNKALIKVLQAIVGVTADGAFGNQTKAKCPVLPDTAGKLSADVVEKATYLVKYALCCNGYTVAADNAEWSTELEAHIKMFQSDLKLSGTGKADVDTWMSLLLSKGNPDRACVACDTRFEITDERAEELKRKGYSIVGRYLTGTTFKVLRNDEPQRILDNGLNFFPIFQESTTDISYFTAERGKTDANRAASAARKFRIPDGAAIYFAVDLDATSPQITKNVLPYFKALHENMDEAYPIGIYGTRNVCTQVCNAGYADTCFVSDMSTGYSGNMGFKMPMQWNFDQFAEINMGNGDWAIDKDAYAGKYEPVKALETYVYKMPEKPEIAGVPMISTIFPMIEALEDIYVDYYDAYSHEFADNGILLTARTLASGITNFFRSVAYKEWHWFLATLRPIDERFISFVKEQDISLFDRLDGYRNDKLLADVTGGLIDFKHLCATAEGYFDVTSVPASWFGWVGDLSTAMKDTDKRIAEKLKAGEEADYQIVADGVIGSERDSFPYEDICSDADAIKIADLISKSKSTAHSFSESLRAYYESTYVEGRFTYYLDELGCLPNLTSLRNAITHQVQHVWQKVPETALGEPKRPPSAEAELACCRAFANYIYTTLAAKQ